MTLNDCKACAARDRLIAKLQKEIVRLNSRVKTFRKKAEEKK